MKTSHFNLSKINLRTLGLLIFNINFIIAEKDENRLFIIEQNENYYSITQI